MTMDESDETIFRAMAEFPTLAPYAKRYREAGKGFNASQFRQDFYAGKHGSGATHAFKFICHLWNPSSAIMDVGAFCVFAAMQSWDSNHKRAFATWALNPTMP